MGAKSTVRIEAKDKKAGLSWYDLYNFLGKVPVDKDGNTMSPITIKAEVGFKGQIKALIVEAEVK